MLDLKEPFASSWLYWPFAESQIAAPLLWAPASSGLFAKSAPRYLSPTLRGGLYAGYCDLVYLLTLALRARMRRQSLSRSPWIASRSLRHTFKEVPAPEIKWEWSGRYSGAAMLQFSRVGRGNSLESWCCACKARQMA